MIEAFIYSLISVIIVSLLSFVGALSLTLNEKTLHKILVYFVGFSAGALFGDAFFHLLPEAAKSGFTIATGLFVLSGIVFSFIVEKIIHWHHCHNPEHHKSKKVKTIAYMNLVGDAVHNFIDGLIIGGSYLVSFPVGFATTLAVIFHEIPQELGDFGILIYSGLKRTKALFFNFLSALTCVLGVLIVFFIPWDLTKFLVPFAVGTFLYIAGSDLIPELHEEKELGKGVMQVVVFLLGIGVMGLLLLLE